MSHMILSPQRITQSMHSRTPRITKRNTRIISRHQKILHQRNPGLLTMIPDLHITLQDHLDRLIPKHPCSLIPLRRKTGLHRMHQRINRTRSKKLERQILQKLRDQHCRIPVKLLHSKPFLRTLRSQGKNRNIRHLRTRTTGSRNQHQLLILHDRKQPVIKIRNRRNILQCKQLGKIQNAAATNRNHTLRILRHILPDCLSHHIRRLALTIILTEDHITAKPQRLKKFLKQSLIGKKQIPFTKFKFLRKLPAIIKTVNRRSDHQFLHSFSSCQPRISQKLFL